MQQQLGAGLEEGALDGEPDVVPIALLVALLPGQRQSVADVVAVAVGVDHVALDSSQHQVEHPAVLGVDLDRARHFGEEIECEVEELLRGTGHRVPLIGGRCRELEGD